MIDGWKEKEIERTADRIKAVAHPTRLAIACLLADGERCVGDIQTQVGSSQPNVTHHITILHNLKLLKARKDANRVFYALGDTRITEFISRLRQIHCPDEPA